LDDDEKKELKKEDDDTSFHDDKLDKPQTSSSKLYLLAFKKVLKSLGPGVITGLQMKIQPP
jgi:hypothetical protein